MLARKLPSKGHPGVRSVVCPLKRGGREWISVETTTIDRESGLAGFVGCYVMALPPASSMGVNSGGAASCSRIKSRAIFCQHLRVGCSFPMFGNGVRPGIAHACSVHIFFSVLDKNKFLCLLVK